jgi:hypothetical protein
MQILITVTIMFLVPGSVDSVRFVSNVTIEKGIRLSPRAGLLVHRVQQQQKKEHYTDFLENVEGGACCTSTPER